MSDYLNIYVICIATLLTFVSLIRLSRHKKTFYKYPDQIKNELFKDARSLTFLNFLSFGFILVGYFFYQQPLSYVFLFISLFISGTCLLEFNEDHGEEYEESLIKEKEEKIRKKQEKQQKKAEKKNNVSTPPTVE